MLPMRNSSSGRAITATTSATVVGAACGNAPTTDAAQTAAQLIAVVLLASPPLQSRESPCPEAVISAPIDIFAGILLA